MNLHLPHHLPHPDPDALSLWYALALCAACIVAVVVIGYSLTSYAAGAP